MSPEGHLEMLVFTYLPGPSGHGILEHSASVVGERGIKLYVTEYVASPPVIRAPLGTV